MCGHGCGRDFHGWCHGGWLGQRHGIYGPSIMTIEEEIEILEEMKEAMEKQLDNVNRRLEVLRKGS